MYLPKRDLLEDWYFCLSLLVEGIEHRLRDLEALM